MLEPGGEVLPRDGDDCRSYGQIEGIERAGLGCSEALLDPGPALFDGVPRQNSDLSSNQSDERKVQLDLTFSKLVSCCAY